MADGTPVTYEDLTDELKKKYDEVKTILEADLIGSFHRTRSHGIGGKGSPEGALDGMNCPPRQKNAPAPEVPNSPAFVVYKIGGDPSDCQFLHEAPKEIPHGYMCTYVPDCGNWALTNQAATAGTSGRRNVSDRS
ncbi:hypothetical protein QYE76_058635 [Lolium multiflorum]|uniref:Uncharacterized protein n=1 Tax=Lolium multiflorum TaxID=4521 RepID=A0AAD8T776_LOLMU|nr:hypothetical protein QYE76_058635 [Lolium multiflorum]